jgi:hypothetical protein
VEPRAVGVLPRLHGCGDCFGPLIPDVVVCNDARGKEARGFIANEEEGMSKLRRVENLNMENTIEIVIYKSEINKYKP